MTPRERIHLSKFLSLVLRHRPQRIGVELAADGWLDVDELIQASRNSGRTFDREQLELVVAQCDKQRFALSPCGTRIRANQGHSIPVELGYEVAAPPRRLYHGTTDRRIAAIRREGLRRMKRHHVHLSEDTETARRVGARHGEPIVLEVQAAKMHAAGHAFSVSANRVWLTEHVPTEFLTDLGS